MKDKEDALREDVIARLGIKLPTTVDWSQPSLVIEVEATTSGETSLIQIDSSGCAIGRGEDALISLPHPEVSSMHARIGLDGEGFFIVDESTNGTFIESEGVLSRLPGGQMVRVAKGDVFVVAEYRLAVLDLNALPEGLTTGRNGDPSAEQNRPSTPDNTQRVDRVMAMFDKRAT